MWVKEKFYRKKLKKILTFTLLILLFQSSHAYSSIKEKIIKTFNETKNISFNFEQLINDKKEYGECILEYPKLIYCLYAGKDKKKMVSNGKSLVIKNLRKNNYYIYPLKKTSLNYLLDKKFLINQIKNSKLLNDENKLISFQIENNSTIINVYFDNKTFDMLGWETIDMYKNKVNFKILKIKKNITINKKIFILPKSDQQP